MKSINVVALVPFSYGSIGVTPPPSKDVASRANTYELGLVPNVAAALCRSGQAAPSFPADSDRLAMLTGERHAPFFDYAHTHSKHIIEEPPAEAMQLAEKPISNYTKAELVDLLKGHAIDFPSDARKDDLLKLAEASINA